MLAASRAVGRRPRHAAAWRRTFCRGSAWERWRVPPAAAWRRPRPSSGAAGGGAPDFRPDPEVAEFAAKSPRPTTLEEIVSCLEPWRAAKFIQGEMPIRFAERIRSIEGIKRWREIPELVEVHEIHLRAFRLLVGASRDRDLLEFTSAIDRIVREQKEVVAKMAVGMRSLRKMDPTYARRAFIDSLLDGFLLNRLGSNVLMTQYLALQNSGWAVAYGSRGRTGIVDLACNVLEVCEMAAGDAQQICEDYTGWRPVVRIEAHSTVGQDQGMPKMAYIPAALRYIMVELLKNSCRATVEAAREDGLGIDVALRGRLISIVVCADEHNVAICLSDRAKGIPFEVGSHVWSYLYSTAAKTGGQTQATELAGYGVGLPLSRLFARYLGGSLDLISLPGYGTHAYLWLPRLLSEQVEVVPDSDAPSPAYPSLSDRAL